MPRRIAIRGGVDILVLNSNVINLLERDLQDLAESLRSHGRLRQLFEKIRDEVLIPSFRKNFEVGGRPRWEPLSQITTGLGREAFIATGAGTIGGRVPLTKSGQMKRAATAKARFIIRNNEMHFGNWPEKRWFGPVHNLPELSELAKVPNRPFTLMQKEDQVAIQEITGDWVEDRVNQHIRRRYV